MEGNNEVCSVDQSSGKQKVNDLQELADQGWKLSSVITAEQLLSSKSPSDKKINTERSSIKSIAQATAGVEELLLLDPP